MKEISIITHLHAVCNHVINQTVLVGKFHYLFNLNQMMIKKLTSYHKPLASKSVLYFESYSSWNMSLKRLLEKSFRDQKSNRIKKILPIVFLQNGILCAQVQRHLAIQCVLKGCMSKIFKIKLRIKY